MKKKKPTIAIAYDFDGTLAPGNMQEHQFLPDIGMTAKAFWNEVHEMAGIPPNLQTLFIVHFDAARTHGG